MTANVHETPQTALRPPQAYLVYSLCAAIFLFPFMRVLTLGSDEGILLTGAARILHGDVFARDFVEVMGPGSFYALAAFFKLFGIAFTVARLYLFLSLLGTAIALYYLARHICPSHPLLPSILLASTYFGMFGQGVSYHVDSNLLALLSVASMLLWQSRRKRSFLLLAGALAGATTCVLQPKGGLLLLAFIVWFGLERKRVPTPLRSIALTLAGYAAVVGAMLAYFWCQGALRSLAYVDFYFPYQHYSGVNEVGYAFGLHDFWHTWSALGSGALWSKAMASAFLVPYLLIAALPLLLIVYGLRSRKLAFEPSLLLLWLTGCGCWLSEIHRRDTYHLVFGSPLLLLLLIRLAGSFPGRPHAFALKAIAVCAIGLAGFNWLTVAAVPHASTTRAGAMRLFESDRALQYLIAHTAPREEIFVYPDAPMYYFLAQTTNPTPYSLLTYNFYTPQQFQNAIDILERRKIEYVVWDTEFIAKSSKTVLPGSQPENPKDLLMEHYLQSHYTPAAQFGGIQILLRNQPEIQPRYAPNREEPQ